MKTNKQKLLVIKKNAHYDICPLKSMMKKIRCVPFTISKIPSKSWLANGRLVLESVRCNFHSYNLLCTWIICQLPNEYPYLHIAIVISAHLICLKTVPNETSLFIHSQFSYVRLSILWACCILLFVWFYIYMYSKENLGQCDEKRAYAIAIASQVFITLFFDISIRFKCK